MRNLGVDRSTPEDIVGHPRLHVMDHPLVHHHLANLRDKTTPSAEFRRLIHRLAMLVAYEATDDLNLATCTIETPIESVEGHRLRGRIGLVPILRAGLGMVDAVHELIPDAEVWHLGLYRDEATATPVQYYSKLPNHDPLDVALILDPMLATGGSLLAAYEKLKDWGVSKIKMVSIIAAPEGTRRLLDETDAEIHVCAMDRCLNAQKFIVPGLGDAGDRTFRTAGES